MPLITASILSKKLAAGVQALVMDVKVGSGAFCATLAEARTLARSLVDVAGSAGLPCEALITDMNQVLGTSAGNALEVAESIAFLTGRGPNPREPRLLEVTLALAARLLRLGGVCATPEAALQSARQALESGRAAERFAKMVAGLGGPADVLAEGGAGLPRAPVQRDVPAPRDGVLASLDTRAVGLAVVRLGGGRSRATDAVDLRVGFSAVRPLGSHVRAGEAVARVHAASAADADAAVADWLAALRMESGVAIADRSPVLGSVVRGAGADAESGADGPVRAAVAGRDGAVDVQHRSAAP